MYVFFNLAFSVLTAAEETDNLQNHRRTTKKVRIELK